MKTDYYNQIAKGYNELHGEEQKKKLAIVKKYIKTKPNETLLDIGCGTGISSDFKCKVTGIEPSKELIKQAKIKTIVGKAEKLPFPDKSFDYIISLTAAQNFEDIPKAIQEMKRVLKKEGAISILKKSRLLELLKKELKKNFKIENEIEEEKDIIFIIKNIN